MAQTRPHARPEHGSIITDLDATEGAQRASRAIRDLFEARYDAATGSEKNLMIALARLGGDQPVRRAELAEALGKSTQAISGVRNQLLGKAVVSEPERGHLQFTLPGFAEFVLDKSE